MEEQSIDLDKVSCPKCNGEVTEESKIKHNLGKSGITMMILQSNVVSAVMNGLTEFQSVVRHENCMNTLNVTFAKMV